MGVANALPTTTAVTLANAAGAALNLNGNAQTIGSLSGGGGAAGGNVNLGLNGVLTVGDTSSTVFAGQIRGSAPSG